MAQKMNVPILGLVENMSYLTCTGCGKELEIFGPSKVEKTAKEFGLPVAVRLPLNPAVAKAVDDGQIETVRQENINPLADKLMQLK